MIVIAAGIILILISIPTILSGVGGLIVSGLIVSGAGALTDFLIGLIPQFILDAVDMTILINSPSIIITDVVEDTANIAVMRLRWFSIVRIIDGALLIFIGFAGVFSNNKALLLVLSGVGIILVLTPLSFGIPVLRLITLVVYAIGSMRVRGDDRLMFKN